MANALGKLFGDIAEAIRAKTGEEGTMKPAEFPAKIGEIEGTSSDVRYVTFMNGETELYRKPVAVGDDCVNVVSKGLISTPTKESTVSQVFTYSGWALADGVSADASALEAVTEDRTVYAAYSATTRKYTVTYYDEDGTTILNTESLDYGMVPSFTPAKTGFSFNGWVPEISSVTGNATYIASWMEKVEFATSDWGAISAVSESGKARQYFSIGDSRTETITYGDKNYTVTLKIAGFDHDDLADGSGKAGMSIMCHTAILNPVWATQSKGARSYAESNFKTVLTNFYNSGINQALKPCIKTVKKVWNNINTESYTTGNCQLFVPSAIECGWDKLPEYKDNKYKEQGSTYELYADSFLGNINNHKVTNQAGNIAYRLACRSVQDYVSWYTSYGDYAAWLIQPNSNGTVNMYASAGHTVSVNYFMLWGFCI